MGGRVSFARVVLWLFVVVVGIGVGAGLYEALIIMPLWSGAPPESVWGWRELHAANPMYAPRAGERFWIFVSPARALLALALLVTALRTGGPDRPWRLVASIIILLLFALAVFWLIPASAELFAREGKLSGEEVIARTRTWVTLNHVFQALGLAAFLAGLRALSIGSAERPVSA